jgi:hypothetical protein
VAESAAALTGVGQVCQAAWLHEARSQQIGGIPLQHSLRQLNAPGRSIASSQRAHKLPVACQGPEQGQEQSRLLRGWAHGL